MSTRGRPIDRGRRLAHQDRLRLGDEIRTARHITGRSLDAVASMSGLSPSQAGRIERGALETVSVDQLARLGAAVGLDVRTRSYPGPDPTLDAAQIALLGRLQGRLGPSLTLRMEVPLPIAQDQRAWDGLIGGLRAGTGLVGGRPDPLRAPAQDAQSAPTTLPAEAETRLVDLQGQVRRVMLKLRDSGFDAVLLVVADTARNRDVLVAAAAMLRADFPVSGRQALAALRSGLHPGGSAIVVL